MSKRKLDPYTLRYVVRRLRFHARRSERLAPSFAASDQAWADVFLMEARSLESATRKKAAK